MIRTISGPRRPARSRAPQRSVETLENRSLLSAFWSSYARDAQHTALSTVAAQSLEGIRWQTPVDLAPQYSGNDLLIHYGSPLITTANTVIVPVKTGASGGFELQAHNGADGSLMWTQTTDYILPPHGWVPSFSPTMTASGRIYYQGAGGTLYYIDNPDSSTPTAATQIAFYGISSYTHAGFDGSVYIDTPLTIDSAGDIFFGFTVTGSNPLNLQSGIARIGADGTGSWVAATTAANDPGIIKVAMNSAPALSSDGKTLYVAVSAGDFQRGDLLALDSTTLATKGLTALKDPSSGSDALVADDGTASPTVGPDGDVYFGVLENPFPAHHDRGWMLHFSSDLATSKTPGSFGWDDSASIVPASMVPSYNGTSSYLLMTKYNNYGGVGGDGVNKIAILDPNATMQDPYGSATVMKEVLTIAGVSPDDDFRPGLPNAVREWCINTAAIDPATKSVLANSEDGTLYRWDMTTNTFTQKVVLTSGLGEAYTPTEIGPDGTVYAINNATLFAVGRVNPIVATNDAYSTLQQTPLQITAPGVLSNDIDPEPGQTMTAVQLTNPAHGTLSFHGDGSLMYVPNTGYFGPDSFTYEATDGQLTSAPAIVTLIVRPDTPPAAVTDSYTTAEDSPLSVVGPGVLANDTNFNPNHGLTAALVTGPAHGQVTLNPDGSFVYTPSLHFHGTDTFTYKDNDGIVSGNTGTVTLTVTFVDYPPVVFDASYSTLENTPLQIAAPGMLATATDVENDPLSAHVVTGPTHGALTLNIDGSFTYTPATDFHGTDSFTYKANDGHSDGNTATVTLNVAFVNQPPVAVDDSYTTEENTLIQVVGPGVLANDTDVENDSLTAHVVSGPSHGALTFNPDGSFAYTPATDFHGTDSFTYKANDGTSDGNTATVTLKVMFVNQPPVAFNTAFSANENETLIVPADSGVLANASDPENDPLTAVLASTPPHGSVTLNRDGSFTYNPNPGYVGADSFTYYASDGVSLSNQVTAQINVAFVNQPPIVTAVSISASQGVPLTGATLATFTAIDGVHDPSRFVAFVDFGDATSLSAASVSPVGTILRVTGDHTYGAVGAFAITVYVEEVGGGAGTGSGTSSASVTPAPGLLSGRLSPTSDSGVSHSDGITNIATPTLIGTASPNQIVHVFAQAAGSGTFTLLGDISAAANGTWSLVAPHLADGTYTITASVLTADGATIQSGTLGTIKIDTTGPRILGAQLDPRSGRISIIYQDDLSGLSQAGIVDRGSYVASRVVSKRVHRRITVTVPAGPGVPSSIGAETVVLTLNGGKRVARGRLLFSIASAGITDVAGNRLDGEFSGRFPSGNGQPGGDFQAEFITDGRRLVSASVPAGSSTVAKKAPSTVHPKAFASFRHASLDISRQHHRLH
jgi:hypothetical protein